MRTSSFPPRLHVLRARDAPFGLIILRAPRDKSKHYTCTIGWDFTKDTFELGQWLKGRIYEHRCDLSPDGKHFLYFVANYHGSWRQGDSTRYSIWTALSRAPHLKALVFSGQKTTYGGGGLFEDDTHFWLNGCDEAEKGIADGLDLTAQPSAKLPWGMNDDDLYDLRLRRNGWRPREILSDHKRVALWEKKRNAWTLQQFSRYDSEHPLGLSYFWQWCQTHDSLSGEILGDQSWEWADFHNDRLLWAQGGKIFATTIWDGGHGDILELANFNDWKFQARQAPY